MNENFVLENGGNNEVQMFLGTPQEHIMLKTNGDLVLAGSIEIVSGQQDSRTNSDGSYQMWGSEWGITTEPNSDPLPLPAEFELNPPVQAEWLMINPDDPEPIIINIPEKKRATQMDRRARKLKLKD